MTCDKAIMAFEIWLPPVVMHANEIYARHMIDITYQKEQHVTN